METSEEYLKELKELSVADIRRKKILGRGISKLKCKGAELSYEDNYRG